MVSFKQGYKRGYRTGMYLAVDRCGNIRMFPKNHDPRHLYNIKNAGDQLFFVKQGTQMETIYNYLSKAFLNFYNPPSHPNFINIDKDDLPREVRY